MGCDIYVGRDVGSVCPITALGSYLSLRGSAPGPLFMLVMVALLLGSSYHLLRSQFYMVQGTLALTLVTASVLEQGQLRRHGGFLITSSKP